MSDSSTDALLVAGQAALRAGRFVEALESYERVLDHHQPDAWPGCDDACEAALRGHSDQESPKIDAAEVLRERGCDSAGGGR